MKVLGRGGALGMFPEGHRSKDGKLQRGRPGAALVAMRTGALILPVAISGTRTFLQWPTILRRPYVRVRIGRPFVLSSSDTSSSRDKLAEGTDEMMMHIAELLPPEQWGEYASAMLTARARTPVG